MQFLLMAEEEVTTSEAASTFGAFERLLFRMRPLVAFEMFQAVESLPTGATDVWPWFFYFCIGRCGVARG